MFRSQHSSHRCARHARSRKIRIALVCIVFISVAFRIFTEPDDRQNRRALRLGRVEYHSQPTGTGERLDTYFRRIEQFLTARNVSLLAYESTPDIDTSLLPDFDKEIAHLRKLEQEELKRIRFLEATARGCLPTCCWTKRHMTNFYNGESNRVPTVLDRLSVIDLKLLADAHFGQLRVPSDMQLPKLTEEMLPCLQNGTTIFVDTRSVKYFLAEMHPKILVNYILMSGDSDMAYPLQLERWVHPLLDEIFAGRTRIVQWFVMNCHPGSNQLWRTSTIFSCLPQGISQWVNARYYQHLASGKDDSFANRFLKTNDYWLLASFDIEHSTNYRRPLWSLVCHGRLKNISKCFYQGGKLNPWRYLLHVARSKFVLSPPGDGMDCYRTWEALYVGSIPIIVESSINSIFDRLPVLIVKRYEDITLPFLENVYENMTRQTYDYRRLYKGYWQRQINRFRNSSNTIQFQYSIRGD